LVTFQGTFRFVTYIGRLRFRIYIITLHNYVGCKQDNHDNNIIRAFGKGDACHRKQKRLKLCGG